MKECARWSHLIAALISEVRAGLISRCWRRVGGGSGEGGECEALRDAYFVGTRRFSSSNQLRTSTISRAASASGMRTMTKLPSGKMS
jgi:hypothetical protein